ncbi:sulfite exporter TauE/SafE family protein [Limosilactobacillus caecicola]|uniref:sulfite exporter TauE/SafE family protein n=1 Tax=Limosilactobacillus caecicola TaxID=2941332 RepID=UPI00203B2BEE|nr:sulfite exporter TauE/SafE family protein [Limosilactobacillus caecicola]
MMSLPSFWVIIYLILGGILAGISASAASFASLISYPLLLSVGIPPVFANVTNDGALIWNSLGSILSSLKELNGHWREVFYYAFYTVIGSVIGCFLLLRFPGKVFERVVPFFILLAAAMIIISGHHQPTLHERTPSVMMKIWSPIGLVLVGIYAGYFGAASGIVVLVLLTYVMNENFMVTNAVKNAVGAFTNLVALIIYALTSTIYWFDAIPMAVGMFIGGYIGPIIVRHVSATLIRWVIAILAVIQAIIYFKQAYF